MTTIPEIFGSNVFSRAVMKERLPKKVYAEVVNCHGERRPDQHGNR